MSARPRRRPHRRPAASTPVVPVPAVSTGFPPVIARGARWLVLGSLPGQASLAARQYYAHPQNAFWRIMARIVGFDAEAPYEQRLAALARSRIALWDVCHAARRPGSLDARILAESVVPNDFATLLRKHPTIERIGINGSTAFTLFGRLVEPQLPARWQMLPRVRLPSTSPAHARMSFARKLEIWSRFFEN